MNLICICYSFNEIDVWLNLDSEINRKSTEQLATHFGTTEYVIDINLICNGYGFDMYSINFWWNRHMMTSWFGEKQRIHRAAHFGTTHYVINMDLICDGYEFDMY